MKRLRKRPTLHRAAAWLLLSVVTSHAQSVQFDASFAPSITDNRAVGGFTALQRDGKILADAARVRYNADGIRDASYSLAPNLAPIRLAVVASDGRIVAVASSNDGTKLVRLKADGSLDAILDITLTFGVDRLVPQADGRILLIANNSTITAGGVIRRGIARLNADGSFDPTFDTGFGTQLNNGGPASGLIWSVALQVDGRILVGGYFSAFDGAARNGLVRLNANGTVDPSFIPATSSPATMIVLHVVALPGGKAIVFERGATNRLLRLNADGSFDSMLGSFQPNGGLFGSTVQSDGRVLLGGEFTGFGGTPRRNLLRLNADGTLDQSFDASASAPQAPTGFAVQTDGKIFVNALDVTSDLPANGLLIRLNPDGSLDPSFMPGPPRTPTALVAARYPDGRIALGGTFTTINGATRTGVARLLANGTVDPAFVPAGVSPTVVSVIAALPDGRVVVAGALSSIAGTPRSGLTRFSTTGALDALFAPTLSAGGVVNALLALPNGRIVIGGSFSTVNGTARTNLAALMADGSLDPVFAASAALNGTVTALAARVGGGVFVAGTFSAIESQRRTGIAALTAAGAVDATFVPAQLSTNDTIMAFASMPDGGVVIATPKPTNGVPRAYLRRLKNTGEIDSSYVFPFEVNASFTALAADAQGRVLAAYAAAESFETGPVTPRFYLQRFTTTGAWDSGFNVGAGPSARIGSLDIGADGTVLVSGLFDRFDDLPRASVIRLNVDVPSTNSPSMLFNISTRGETAPGANVLTAGFVVSGSVPKTVLLRAIGPGLSAFGVASAVTDPRLSLFRADGTLVASNDNWSGAVPVRPIASARDAGFHVAQAGARAGAFPLQSPLEAALLATLAPGNYTAQVATVGGTATTGITLVEVYDANAFPGDRRLVNISTRGTAGPGDRTLIAGFVISGSAPKQVLVRAAGPGLAVFNVTGALADPTLTVVNSSGFSVVTNDDWSDSANKSALAEAAAKVGAFAFVDPSKDSAVLLTLQPGSYTALVSGAANTTGVALVEVYEMP